MVTLLHSASFPFGLGRRQADCWGGDARSLRPLPGRNTNVSQSSPGDGNCPPITTEPHGNPITLIDKFTRSRRLDQFLRWIGHMSGTKPRVAIWHFVSRRDDMRRSSGEN